MNKQPFVYMQTDPRWKDKPYRVQGENSTVGGSGCGPTCCAMVITSLKQEFLPLDACNWSVAHGYKALNQGTFYSYIEAQLKAFGIGCSMLNWQNTYKKPLHENHEKVMQALHDGYWAIALMGKGLWTQSGHFVLVWEEDGKIHINDPASTAVARTLACPEVFKSQVKYYWLVDARSYNAEVEKEMEKYRTLNNVPAWAKDPVSKLMSAGVLSGTGKDSDGTVVLDLSEDLLRSIMIAYKGGAYDKALVKAGFSPVIS